MIKADGRVLQGKIFRLEDIKKQITNAVPSPKSDAVVEALDEIIQSLKKEKLAAKVSNLEVKLAEAKAALT